MEFEHRSRRGLTEELESLRRQISELKDMGGENTVEPVTPAQQSLQEPAPLLQDEGLLFGQILDSSHDGVFAFNLEFTIIYWNNQMEEISGLQEGGVLGKKASDVFSTMPEIGENRCLLEALKGDTITVRGRTYHIAPADREGIFDGRYGPLRDTSGELQGGYGIIHDITERRRVEETLRAVEASYRELFEKANDIVYTHDLEGNLTSLNKAAERITGFTRAEALQMNLVQLVAPDYQQTARKMIDRQISFESPTTDELEILTKDGSRVALEISSHLIYRDGNPVGVQGIARDVTERKKTEEALQQAKQNLEAWVDELEQRTREMTLLSEMGDMLRACLTTDEAYTVIVRVAQQIFPGQIGALYAITPSRNLVEAVAVWGTPSLAERVFAPDECWGLRRGRVHYVKDARVGLLCKHLHHPPPPAYLCVPMMAQSEALGVLHLSQSQAEPLTEAKQRLALTMAEHIAMALSNLKLHETLRSQSIRDPLTNLFNRRFMEESLELELRRAARNQRPLGVIMLDLDGFKRFNDNHGHDAGDTLLRELGALLQANIRAEDIACRYGGEEFTLILPEGNLEITQQRAETLRQAIKNLDIQHRGQALGSVTASMGVAIFPEHGKTGDALLRAADAALYDSKGGGGDLVSTATIQRSP